jgi:hypothetical protein
VDLATRLLSVVYLEDVDRFVYVYHEGGTFSSAAVYFEHEDCVGDNTLALFPAISPAPNHAGIVHSASGKLWETNGGPGLFPARSRLNDAGECVPYCGPSSGCNIINSYRAIEVPHPSWPPTLPLSIE